MEFELIVESVTTNKTTDTFTLHQETSANIPNRFAVVFPAGEKQLKVGDVLSVSITKKPDENGN